MLILEKWLNLLKHPDIPGAKGNFDEAEPKP